MRPSTTARIAATALGAAMADLAAALSAATNDVAAAVGAATAELTAAHTTYEAAYAEWAAAQTPEMRAAFAAWAVANEVVAAADQASWDAWTVQAQGLDVCLHGREDEAGDGRCLACEEDLELAREACAAADEALAEAKASQTELWQHLRQCDC